MTANRTAINIILAVLDIDQREFADRMGYRPGYVANVFNGFTEPSAAFKQAFGELLADLLLGPSRKSTRLPAKPLAELIQRRASAAPSKSQFFDDLGLSPQGWNKRQYVTESLVDRICCALGVHPSSVYGSDYEIEEAS
jgi:transcriptional regulator with XRE-family HTH domain